MNIAIIGCGYLGMEAAKILKNKDHFITATTRHGEKLDLLAKCSQKAVVIKGDDEGEIAELLLDNDAIIVTVGADGPDLYEDTYLNTAKTIRHVAHEQKKPKALIYTSSTSVYGDHHGQWVDETSPLLGKNDQAKILIETEKQYLSLKEINWKVAILRLSEIYGPGRELSTRVRQLEGHILPGSGEHYTNMIHKADAANAIDYALRHHLEGVFNITDDEHPTRKELYDAVSHKFLLPKVKWDPHHTSLHSGNKRVSNHKIKTEGFALHHAHRLLD